MTEHEFAFCGPFTCGGTTRSRSILISSPRREELTRGECIEYLEQQHTPLVKKLPGLKRFVTAIPPDPEKIRYPLCSDSERYDVMAQLQFESSEDLQAAFNSEDGRRVLQDAENSVNAEKSVVIATDDDTLRYQAVPEGSLTETERCHRIE